MKIILPNELIEIIFSFSENQILESLLKNENFINFHEKIGKIFEKRKRDYWRKIQMDFITAQLYSDIQRHMMNEFSQGLLTLGTSDQRKMFLYDWSQSDFNIFDKLPNMKPEKALLVIKNEQERLVNKYGYNDLDLRPLKFNRYLGISYGELINLIPR